MYPLGIQSPDHEIMSLNPEIEGITVKVLSDTYRAKILLYSFFESKWNDLLKDVGQGHKIF